MNDQYAHYRRALIEELQPAMGCTEPIALAYAAAEAGRRLGGYPEGIEVEVSRNIVKNVKSVIVPNTGGLYGIEAAVAAGFVARRPEAKLQVLAEITDAERAEIGRRVKEPMVVRQSNEPDVFFIRITGRLNGRTDTVTIRKHHTNITCIEEDGRTILSEGDAPEEERAVEKWRIADLIAAARVTTFLMLGLVIVFENHVLGLFTTSESVMAFALARILWVVTAEPINVVMETVSDAMRGYGYSMPPAMVTLFCISVIRVIWVYTVFAAEPTFQVLMAVYPVSWVITTIALTWLYFRHQKTLTPKVRAGRAAG